MPVPYGTRDSSRNETPTSGFLHRLEEVSRILDTAQLRRQRCRRRHAGDMPNIITAIRQVKCLFIILSSLMVNNRIVEYATRFNLVAIDA